MYVINHILCNTTLYLKSISAGMTYNANYVNPESGYPANHYSYGYGMMPPPNSMQPVSPVLL